MCAKQYYIVSLFTCSWKSNREKMSNEMVCLCYNICPLRLCLFIGREFWNFDQTCSRCCIKCLRYTNKPSLWSNRHLKIKIVIIIRSDHLFYYTFNINTTVVYYIYETLFTLYLMWLSISFYDQVYEIKITVCFIIMFLS